MLRFLLRLFGFIIAAAGFVGLVIDGTRSIANGAFSFTPFGEVAYRTLGPRFAAIEPAVAGLHPILWDPMLLTLFSLPASIVAFILGFAMIWLGRKPDPGIGHIARR